MDPRDRLNQITDQIIGAAIAVHSVLGPGLLESAYETCLEHELVQLGLTVERQVPLPVVYRGVRLECGYRLDLLVERLVVVEVKAVSELAPIHDAQLISYLRLSGCKIGLILNFDVLKLRDGIRRLVNDLPDSESVSARSARSAVVCSHKEVS
jgi:GxxExxY protein